jgi:flagellar hook-length control protein FliK
MKVILPANISPASAPAPIKSMKLSDDATTNSFFTHIDSILHPDDQSGVDTGNEIDSGLLLDESGESSFLCTVNDFLPGFQTLEMEPDSASSITYPLVDNGTECIEEREQSEISEGAIPGINDSDEMKGSDITEILPFLDIISGTEMLHDNFPVQLQLEMDTRNAEATLKDYETTDDFKLETVNFQVPSADSTIGKQYSTKAINAISSIKNMQNLKEFQGSGDLLSTSKNLPVPEINPNNAVEKLATSSNEFRIETGTQIDETTLTALMESGEQILSRVQESQSILSLSIKAEQGAKDLTLANTTSIDGKSGQKTDYTQANVSSRVESDAQTLLDNMSSSGEGADTEHRKIVVKEIKMNTVEGTGEPSSIAKDPKTMKAVQSEPSPSVAGIRQVIDTGGSSVQASPKNASVQSNEFISQISERIQFQIRDGGGVMRIRLQPDNFGHLEIHAESTSKGVVARIIAESAGVKSILENNLHILQQNLQDQGVKVDRIYVMIQDGVDAQSFSGYFAKSGHQGSGQTGKDNRRNFKAVNEKPENSSMDNSINGILGGNVRFHTVA